MKINKANDTVAADIVLGLGEDIGNTISNVFANSNPISAAFSAISNLGNSIVGACVDITKTAHQAFLAGLSTNAETIKDNKVKQETNIGLYIIMGVLFVGVILVASLRTKKK